MCLPVDLYICIAFLLAWVYSKEETWAACMIWTLAFVCLGMCQPAGPRPFLCRSANREGRLQVPSDRVVWCRGRFAATAHPVWQTGLGHVGHHHHSCRAQDGWTGLCSTYRSLVQWR